jgi:uncharacterized protein (TIGR03435 family)
MAAPRKRRIIGEMKITGLIGIAVLLAGQAFGQTFEVASVKLVADPGQGLPKGFSVTPRRSGGRISWTTNQTLLLRYAYNLPDWRIVRMDKDHDEASYAIDATMDEAATEDQVRAMLQNLLVTRFGLTSHRESKEVQGYALMVAKNGLKIKAAVPGETPALPDYMGSKPAAAFEGRIFVSAEGKGRSALTGRGVSMTQLADTLSATLGTLVPDRTGIAGNYYFGFRFLSPRDAPGDDTDGATIFTAIQDELGLRLEKQKGAVEVLVVDHLAKPSEN